MANKHATAAELRLCIDRVLPAHMKIDAAQRAISINPHNDPLPVIRRAGIRGVTVAPMKMAMLAGKKWLTTGQRLRIRFLDGSRTQRRKTELFASEWLAFANIRFDWSGARAAEIRISFEADGDSWSAVGTDCMHTEYFKKREPTMNFGWLRDNSEDKEWRRVVVHEFGHALGAIHEHSNPKGGIRWNEEAVYAAFGGPPNNWSRQDIRDNVMEKYSLDQLNATKFDRKSIMLYPFPKELIKGPKPLSQTGTPMNWRLSALDKTFIRRMYPKAR